MIRVFDNKQNLNTKVFLKTINCDGLYRYWYADDIEEFHKWWWDEEYDGPAAEDEVVTFLIDGGCGRGNIQTFDDIVLEYGFNNELDIKPGEVKVKIGHGTEEYVYPV